MEIIDANIVLRYLLNDNPGLSKKAAKILENNNVHCPVEVFAEIIYVLEKVYNVPREKIYNALIRLLHFCRASLKKNRFAGNIVCFKTNNMLVSFAA